MNEEYKLSLNRTEQQKIVKNITISINPNFIVLFTPRSINVSINNNINKSGKL